MNALRRRQRFVNLLNQNNNMSATNLAIALNVSDRTVRNDKNFINSLFEYTVIESDSFSGYFINERAKVEDILNELNCSNWSDNKEILNLVLKAYLFDEFLSVPYLSDQCFTSESSIYSIISDLNNQFEENELKFIIDKNLVKIKVPEINLRSLIINDKDASISYNFMLSKLNSDNLKEYQQLIEKMNALFIKDEKRTINKSIYEEFKKYLLISFIRKNLYSYPVCIDDVKNINLSENIEMKNVLYEFNLDVEYLLLIHDYLFRSADYKNIDFEKQLVLEIFDESNIIQSNHLINDDILVRNLSLHLNHLRMQKNLKIKSNNQILTNIKREYSLPFEIAYFISLEIEKKINLTMDEHDIGFVALHIASSLEESKSDQTTFKGIILSDHRKSIQFLALEKLNKYLRNEVSISLVINSNEINEDYLIDTKYIFISENFPIENLSNESLRDKIIFKISPIPTDKEIKQIQTSVFNKKPSLVHSQIKQLVNPKIFKKNIKAKDKKEALYNVLNHMIRNSVILEETLEGIISRERASPTEIGNLVAIPHTVSKIDESCIGIYLLDKPIKWDREYVQLIVVIVINENNLIKWEEVFTWIFDYFVDGFGIKDLLDDFNYDKFVDSIK